MKWDFISQSADITKAESNQKKKNHFNFNFNKTEVQTKLSYFQHDTTHSDCGCLHVLIGLSVWLLVRKKTPDGLINTEYDKQKGDFSQLVKHYCVSRFIIIVLKR